MAKEIINDLTEGSVTKKLFRFALPFMLSTLLQTAYGLADMAIVGRCVGKEGLSAVSIANQLIWVTTALSIGFTNAGQVIISQLIGSKRREDLQKTVGTVTAVMIIIALCVTAAGLIFGGPILRLMKTPPEAMEGARAYLTVVFLGSVFTFGYNLASSLFRGMGDSKHPLMFVAIASSVNIVLDLVMVALLRWGVVGAAIATVMGQMVSLAISASFMYRNRESLGFDFKLKNLRIDRVCLSRLVRLGFPFALQYAAISISMLFVNRFVNTYGVTASATFGTGTRIEQIPWIMINGIMMAAATMIGQNMGAGKRERMKKVVNISAIVCAASAVVFMALFYMLPGEIYSLFTSDPEVIEMAPMFMLALVVSLPATCMMCPYQAFIEGIGNARLTMIIALLDGFVSRIAISLILAELLHMGLMGWFLGYGLAAYVNTILSVIYYYSGIWKKRKALV